MTHWSRIVIFVFLVFGTVLTAAAGDRVWTFSLPSLNLREHPDISTKVIAKIPYGTVLEVQLTANLGGHEWSRWSQVEYQGNTGWVYSVFLSKIPIEPLPAIRSETATESALVGKWYYLSPFGIGDQKFFHGEVAAASALTFEETGKLVLHDYDGPSGGTWKLRNSNISIRAEGSEDQYTGFEISGSIQLYKVREDWMVLEISSSEKVGNYQQPKYYFMTIPLSAKAKKEVEDWISDETR